MWRRRRDADPADWGASLLPLLSTLGAVQEGVTVELLFALAGLDEPRDDFRRILDERWRPFLAVDETARGRLYRPYHASLRDFLEGRVDRSKFQHANRAFSEELTAATTSAHGRVADRYLSAWGGMAAGLPQMLEPSGRELDGGYGARHLPSHLVGAGRTAELHELLKVERRENAPTPPLRVQVWRWLTRRPPAKPPRADLLWRLSREQSDQTSGFHNDLAHAWRLADDQAIRGATAEARSLAVGWQCRCALTTASITSQADNLSPELLAILVRAGIWSADRGLAYASRMPSDGCRGTRRF